MLLKLVAGPEARQPCQVTAPDQVRKQQVGALAQIQAPVAGGHCGPGVQISQALASASSSLAVGSSSRAFCQSPMIAWSASVRGIRSNAGQYRSAALPTAGVSAGSAPAC